MRAQGKSVVFRLIGLATVILVSLLLLLPNLAPRKLQVAFQNYQKDISTTQKRISREEIEDFIQDPDNGLRYFFPDTKCVFPDATQDSPQENSTAQDSQPDASNPLGQTRCVLEDRFITSATINTLIQAFPNIIEEQNTILLPHFSERLVSSLLGHPKRLAIKLGLDLQGGMRVVLRADFETYTRRIEEKIAALSQEQQTEKAIDALATANEGISNNNGSPIPSPENVNGSASNDSSELQQRIDNLQAEKNLGSGQRQRLLEETREILEKRLAAQNITEAEIRSNIESNSISIDLPGVGKANDVLDKIKNTISVEYRIVDQQKTDAANAIPANQQDLQILKQQAERQTYEPQLEAQILKRIAERSNIPSNQVFLFWRRAYSQSANSENSRLLPRELRILGAPEMDGGDMESAFANPDPNSGGWYQIAFRLTDFGARKFGNLTEKNKGKQLAILWGDRVVSDPVIREPIYGGNGVINGSFTESEAREIAGVIREGALPMPLEIVSINSIGPSLGIEAIQTGMIAILLSFLIVMFFLLFYYRWWGLNAILVLLLNLLFLSAIMSFLGFTFTLPGFAGIVLTIGIAIDASVIIFERLKEELQENQSFRLAVEKGFHASFWTILDANVTTMIAAIILWLPKDGPIMGFAIVLFFGLLVSMYTSLTISRLFFDLIAQKTQSRLRSSSSPSPKTRTRLPLRSSSKPTESS